jgi:hypothetical protein
MSQEHPWPSSHLFTVRLWTEVLGGGQKELRYRVQHVLSGETRYFREWPAVLAYLTAKVQQLEGMGEEGGEM